jgi:LPXTG-motif cell wall-anchored protein
VGIVNRRNAVLGWGVWKLGKRAAKKKAMGAAPSVEGGRPNKSLIAVGLAGLAGALTFWRKKKRGSDSAS